MGKSALLEQLVAAASQFQVVRAEGVEGEVDLPYAVLQRLCRSMSDAIGALPQPQSDALRVAFGLSSGGVPDRYLVGLAALGLLSEVAETQPVLCVVDDAQWVDSETTRALAFVARRLGADSVGLVFASRVIVEVLEGVPELQLGGLSAADSSALLGSVLIGHLDDSVRERVLIETHGNPLALIELPRALTSAEAATGVIRQSHDSLTARIEESFRRQLEPLPAETRHLLLLAAAEPQGDPLLLVRAAAQLGLSVESGDPAEEASLFQIRERCSFRHPLVRSAVYGAATPGERRAAHGALAEATDAELDPDRKAWHRAQATAAPDEDVAIELERTAARAKSRGGVAAAGAFFERAALLTPDGARRAERMLAAAELMFEAGAYDSVQSLLRAVDDAQLDERHAARAQYLHAEVSRVLGGSRETVLELLAAAERLKRFDPLLAHKAHLEALWAAWFLGDPESLDVVARALSESPASESGAIVELIVRGWAQRLEQGGHPAGTELLRKATVALCEKPQLEESDLSLYDGIVPVTVSLWDFDSWKTLMRRTVALARESGSLLALRPALHRWAEIKCVEGDLPAAAWAQAEADAIAEATREGVTATRASPWVSAWRLPEAEALRLIELESSRLPYVHSAWDCARALILNAAGRYEAALEAAQRSCDANPFGIFNWALPELIEAAARSGECERANVALESLVERTRLGSTDWCLGLEARSAALLSDDPAVAEPLYRQAIERLERAGIRTDLARAHLVYGEWLRRESRRIDAREQLHTAHDMLSAIGTELFADRTRRELSATGETARKRTDDTRGDLTAQESQIAQLASEGLTNPEIGAKLFLSPRTIEWHLRRVYPKLGIISRKELPSVLGSS